MNERTGNPCRVFKPTLKGITAVAKGFETTLEMFDSIIRPLFEKHKFKIEFKGNCEPWKAIIRIRVAADGTKFGGDTYPLNEHKILEFAKYGLIYNSQTAPFWVAPSASWDIAPICRFMDKHPNIEYKETTTVSKAMPPELN